MSWWAHICVLCAKGEQIAAGNWLYLAVEMEEKSAELDTALWIEPNRRNGMINENGKQPGGICPTLSLRKRRGVLNELESLTMSDAGLEIPPDPSMPAPTTILPPPTQWEIR